MSSQLRGSASPQVPWEGWVWEEPQLQGSADRPLGVPGRDLKVSNLLMTDKGCVKIGEPLRVCLQLSLCSTSSRSTDPTSPLTSGLFSCSGFRSGTYLRDATKAHDPQSRHAVVSAGRGTPSCAASGWHGASPAGGTAGASCRPAPSLRRYRAPELLLGTTTQTTSIDMW